ncbi:MAG: hypothetical protein ABUL69_03250 [Peristeroidobacter soli]
MNHRAKFLFRPLFFIVMVAALSAIVMLLWNAVLPGLFGTALPIDYLHALGLLVLCRILFGGFRGHGGWHGHGRRHGHWEKWKSMTPEEREKFHARWHGRGRGHEHEPGQERGHDDR